MEKFITICAVVVFAWWFVALSNGGSSASRITNIGPFDTKEECQSGKDWVTEKTKHMWNASLSLSDCRETTNNTK